ncbi:cobalamin biosynthesis protein CobW [Nocardiopsis sp. CNR-923]|uniref:GTP-binding protein n=1 Tax=Nocardiopsis sp. CNR-923 TaxID=1904965 RepID=UPI00095F36EC|nr:GTP-binding protein [Nocardiopsis sp. CNR-923]OLT24971.1 cobalamin biosynthesis protein CobW [Nocardiopsis sp. CNR-923]
MRVLVVTGLHRAARGRTVDALLAAVPRSVAVHHDLGEISEGNVHRVTRDRWGPLDHTPVHLDHLCASCTLREDLVPALLRLAAEGEHALCVVEAWDVVEPRQVAEIIAAQRELELAAVVAAVDADRLLPDLATLDDLRDRALDIAVEDDRTVAEVLAHQIEYPTAIALHGTRHRSEARSLLEQFNPAAAVVVPGAALAQLAHGRFDPEAAANRTNPAWARYCPRTDGRVTTVTWSRRRPLHPERTHGALERLVSSGLRSRGRIWLAGRPDTLLVWDAHGDALVLESGGPWLDALPGAAVEMVSEARRVSALLDWHPVVGDRCQHLAFTGIDMDVQGLVALLDSCLLTEEEAGRPLRTDPFADAL